MGSQIDDKALLPGFIVLRAPRAWRVITRLFRAPTLSRRAPSGARFHEGPHTGGRGGA